MESVQQPQQQSSSSSSTKSKLRYPLLSASKVKDKNSSVAASVDGSVASSTSKRGKPALSLSKTVSPLKPSTKDKFVPRRLSDPAKSAISPLPRSTGKTTPISESRTKGLTASPKKGEQPVSDARRITPRKKFSVLASASYWLSQIKLSETAAKHSVSLGFFKLALESGCEPLQRLSNELKSYAFRHNLVEMGEPVKELLVHYNILEDIEKLQVSQTSSQVAEEVTPSLDEDVSTSSSIVSGKKKTRFLKPENIHASSVAESAPATKQSTKTISPSKNKISVSRVAMKFKSVADVGGDNVHKKSPRPSVQIAKKEEVNTVKNKGKTSAGEKDPVKVMPSVEIEQEDKENKME